MSEIFDNVKSDHDIFTKLVSIIPGFKGYVEMQDRRASDKLVRDQIADRFTQLEKRISEVQTQAISMGAIELLDQFESAAIKLRQFADRIRTAAYGYSPLFAAVKIKKEDLAVLYAYDLALMDKADGIAAAIDNAEASLGTEGITAALRHLTRLSQEAVDAFNHRSQVILEGVTEETPLPAAPALDPPMTYTELPAEGGEEEKKGLFGKIKDMLDGDDN
ncbi:MAG: hypothetical protein HPY85_09560 [Anaerolineae bacterium]|nr:hypothetical protein [Anaerolineae bacterium]